jgi:alpha,alpha-trehalase
VPTQQPPIADYALLANCQSAALVSKDGSIDWCCFRRFDAHSCFAGLLDPQRGGHFRIAPSGRYDTVRRYLPETNCLETRFRCPSGELSLTDLMPVRRTAAGIRPLPELVRIARCEQGEVEVELELTPRFDYGLTIPRMELVARDRGIVYGGADALTFQSDFELTGHGTCHCVGRAVLHAGEEAATIVSHVEPHRLRPAWLSPTVIRRRLDETRRFWKNWAGACTYRGPYRDLVLRSALLLKALTDAETGAIVAAPTTSLPESIGGVRNWDYRYVWLRDAALNLYALFRLGYRDEAHSFMDWIKRTTAVHPEDLRVLYGVGGERLLQEVELAELQGYRGSQPVRVGNAAIAQLQLDVYGELLDTAWLYHRHGGQIDAEYWELLKGLVEVVAKRWQEPDESFWEARDRRQHHVISKAMCWVGVHRAIRLARALNLDADLGPWVRLRNEIRVRIDQEGTDPETGAFVQAFGSSAPDAATLLLPLVRFVPITDPRVRATVEQVERHLTVDGLVYRYRAQDGLPGGEGPFVICSFWMVDNLALLGEVERARRLFERICGYANDLGLLSEQIDPASGELLGNFPQAFSHVGLIGAALNLQLAEQRASEGYERVRD